MSLPDPKTRREVYLNSIANGESVDLTPHTREEVYLDAIANNGGGSGGGTTVVANPELAGTEDALTGLQVGDTKYKVDGSGGGGVLIVTMTFDEQSGDFIGNKTGLECYTAFLNGTSVVLVIDDTDTSVNYAIIAASLQSGTYSFNYYMPASGQFVEATAEGDNVNIHSYLD